MIFTLSLARRFLASSSDDLRDIEPKIEMTRASAREAQRQWWHEHRQEEELRRAMVADALLNEMTKSELEQTFAAIFKEADKDDNGRFSIFTT